MRVCFVRRVLWYLVSAWIDVFDLQEKKGGKEMKEKNECVVKRACFLFVSFI